MKEFECKGTTLCYEVFGEGIPVLLIHGWGIDHNFLVGCMEPVFQAHDQQYQRYYVDLPGMGLSTAGNVQTGDDIVDILIDFILHKLKGQAVILVGNSFGGLLSCGVARKAPELVASMILIAPATGRITKKLPKFIGCKKDERFFSTLTISEQECFAGFNYLLTEDAWEQYKKYIYPAVLANEMNEFLLHKLDGTIDYDLFQTREEERFKKPVLIVTGKQDGAVGYEDPFELSKRYPASTYLAIEEANHNVPYDQPELFRAIVGTWLNQN